MKVPTHERVAPSRTNATIPVLVGPNLVIIDYFDIERFACGFRPFEADSILVIDTNAELTQSIAFERFQPVTAL